MWDSHPAPPAGGAGAAAGAEAAHEREQLFSVTSMNVLSVCVCSLMNEPTIKEPKRVVFKQGFMSDAVLGPSCSLFVLG